jgi:hypothetical protein
LVRKRLRRGVVGSVLARFLNFQLRLVELAADEIGAGL